MEQPVSEQQQPEQPEFTDESVSSEPAAPSATAEPESEAPAADVAEQGEEVTPEPTDAPEEPAVETLAADPVDVAEQNAEVAPAPLAGDQPENQAPVFEEAAAVEEPAPVEEEAAPVEEEPAPVEEEAAPAEDAAPADPLEEFRTELREKDGEWFVVHTYSGMENRVKANLENRRTSLNMEDYIHEIVVPIEDVVEIKNGQRRTRSKPALPGYVLVRMDLTDESWSAVRHTPSVTGFVGHQHQPVPLSLDEVESMLAPAAVATAETQAAGAAGAPAEAGGGAAEKKVESDFSVDDSVLIVEGAFATLHGTITEVNPDTQRVKALVEIFGRETPVELSFNEIQKI